MTPVFMELTVIKSVSFKVSSQSILFFVTRIKQNKIKRKCEM